MGEKLRAPTPIILFTLKTKPNRDKMKEEKIDYLKWEEKLTEQLLEISKKTKNKEIKRIIEYLMISKINYGNDRYNIQDKIIKIMKSQIELLEAEPITRKRALQIIEEVSNSISKEIEKREKETQEKLQQFIA